jgi:predicted Zn-dependent protease
MVFGVAGGGIFAQLAALSSVYGYSRDLEREADQYAFKKILAAGYNVHESVAVFKKLRDETKAYKKKRRTTFFSSHPRMQERIDSFSKLLKPIAKSTGTLNTYEYVNKTHDLRLAVLDLDLNYRRYQSVVLILENNENKTLYPDVTAFHLGEAYRLRGKKGDAERSRKAYLRAIKAKPDYAPPYHALGMYYMKTKQKSNAQEAFTKFLKLAPNHKKASYARYYLKQLQN